ncbi:hypothetical protein F5877DRAFT_83150 [Lentinula edodes]|nr:hypothetical protein F5877DRAFT_83150 [Lentinula edodes]
MSILSARSSISAVHGMPGIPSQPESQAQPEPLFTHPHPNKSESHSAEEPHPHRQSHSRSSQRGIKFPPSSRPGSSIITPLKVFLLLDIAENKMTPVEQELISSSGQIAFFNSQFMQNNNMFLPGAFVLGISISVVFLRKLSLSSISVTNVLVFKDLFMVFLCFTTDAVYFGGFNLTVIRSMFIWQSFPDTATAMLVDSTDITDLMKTMAWRYMPGWKWTATVNMYCLIATAENADDETGVDMGVKSHIHSSLDGEVASVEGDGLGRHFDLGGRVVVWNYIILYKAQLQVFKERWAKTVPSKQQSSWNPR